MFDLNNRCFLYGNFVIISIIIVACWEGQNPRLQAKASAFLATRQGAIEGALPYDLGAWSRMVEPREAGLGCQRAPGISVM